MSYTQQTAPTQYVDSRRSPDVKFAYRRFGKEGTIPFVFLIYFRGTIDHWDPLLINALAEQREIILVDYPGVGKSTGTVPTIAKDYAAHIIEFLDLLGLRKVDLGGFSLGGVFAQMIALNSAPGQIRRLVVAGSSPSIGEGVQVNSPERATKMREHAAIPVLEYDNSFYYIFYPPTETAQAAGKAWWNRIHERTIETSGEERSEYLSTDFADGGEGLKRMSQVAPAFFDPAQRADGSYDRLGDLTIPTFIAQGKDDVMLSTVNSYVMQQQMPNARLKIYPDSGHGFLFQFAQEFAKDVNDFLDAEIEDVA